MVKVLGSKARFVGKVFSQFEGNVFAFNQDVDDKNSPELSSSK